MALGKVKAVVYLQHDPGMYVIGNILRNLTADPLKAPLPIAAEKFGFIYYSELNEGFKDFYQTVQSKPFYKNGSLVDRSQSITSYLCTDNALAIFQRAVEKFRSYVVEYPDFRPTDSGSGDARLLTNAKVKAHTQSFYEYALQCGRRGTPHKL